MISREELYGLVWAEPMTRLAERFEVSGSYLARVCTRLNVPRPQRGYWAKLAVGKAPRRTPLPDTRPGDPLEWSRDGEPVTRPRLEAPACDDRARRVTIARNRVHALIRDARAHFENGRPVEEGAYLKPYKKLLVDVTASAAGLDKALGLANDLFNALHSVGHHVVLAAANTQLGRDRIDEREDAPTPREYWQHGGIWSPYRPTVVYVGTVAIGLTIVEMSENVTLRYLNGQYVREIEHAARARRYPIHSWTTTRELPSGRMRIIAYSPYGQVSWSRQWQETRSTSLRSQLRAIVETIEASAPDLVAMIEEADRQAEVRRHEWLAQEERRRREDDRKRFEESIADSKTELGQVIENWSSVMGIERFLLGVEQRAEQLEDPARAHVLERLALAREFLGSLDPLDFFRAWKTPGERYSRQYPEEEHPATG
jgi:hypothetical protein